MGERDPEDDRNADGSDQSAPDADEPDAEDDWFAELDGSADESTGTDGPVESDEPAERDEPVESDGADEPTGRAGIDGPADADDPFEALPDRPVDSEEFPEDPFTGMDVRSIDEGAVWEELAATAVEAGDGEHNGTAPAAGPADADERRVSVVPKRSYCERCEHFSEPPDVACRHPDTEIVELVDVNHFRVIDCPVVEQRREIDESPEAPDPREGRPQDESSG